ncbi:protein FAM194B [Anopheles sinensis]|uniref:Protein FAM194B n=1 Tax=Anopheles sinensis TaxID=74873 RepID=A0A084VRB0_ANOSI|nr:protein FAM194B [Anopheles sinensis]
MGRRENNAGKRGNEANGRTAYPDDRRAAFRGLRRTISHFFRSAKHQATYKWTSSWVHRGIHAPALCSCTGGDAPGPQPR